jgi:hypothetical protein
MTHYFSGGGVGEWGPKGQLEEEGRNNMIHYFSGGGARKGPKGLSGKTRSASFAPNAVSLTPRALSATHLHVPSVLPIFGGDQERTARVRGAARDL